MIVSSSVTVGQLTFILRVAVQILGYGGLALIGIIILGNVPRVAPIDTHDAVNRIVGASSVSLTTIKWIFNRLRRNHSDPSPQAGLLLVLFLFVSYGAFISLSDIGFLGFYSCSIPGPSITDFPASVLSDDDAQLAIRANLVNGTDPGHIYTYRCDSTEILQFGNVTENHCIDWRNSTYADRSLFEGLNSTDSDV